MRFDISPPQIRRQPVRVFSRNRDLNSLFQLARRHQHLEDLSQRLQRGTGGPVEQTHTVLQIMTVDTGGHHVLTLMRSGNGKMIVLVPSRQEHSAVEAPSAFFVPRIVLGGTSHISRVRAVIARRKIEESISGKISHSAITKSIQQSCVLTGWILALRPQARSAQDDVGKCRTNERIPGENLFSPRIFLVELAGFEPATPGRIRATSGIHR